MSLFGFFKKKQKVEQPHTNPSIQIEWNGLTVNKIDEKVCEDDIDLPFGWITHNKEFIEPLEKEFSYFMHNWINAESKSPKELYSALKSFVYYMEDVKRLCSSKGEHFKYWCDTVLIGNDYFETRKSELEDLSTKWIEMQKEYEIKQHLLSTLPSNLMDFLNDNNGILQADVYKHFSPVVKSEIQSLLYEWDKTGKISKEKSGKSYKITVQL